MSLNSPVVTLEPLPPGPASAGVALHDRGATLCVRSLRTGQALFYTTTEDLADHRQMAQDAALSLAESMGFLFDDDVVQARGDQGPEEAARLWRELCGDRAVFAEAEVESATRAEAPGSAAPAAPSALQSASSHRLPLLDPASVLTKFRFRAEATA